MSVQSARVQQIVKGDDAVMLHQLMTSVAYNAEVGRTPVVLNVGDQVNFFYPLEDPTQGDLIGYPGIPTAPLPGSSFNAILPAQIIAPLTPDRGTTTFQSGLGRTVRAEVSRQIGTPNGNTTTGSMVITAVSDFTNVAIGFQISGAGIPVLGIITAFDPIALTITMNVTATADGSGVIRIGKKETYYLIDEVDVFERGFPNSLEDTSGGVNPPPSPLNLT